MCLKNSHEMRINSKLRQQETRLPNFCITGTWQTRHAQQLLRMAGVVFLRGKWPETKKRNILPRHANTGGCLLQLSKGEAVVFLMFPTRSRCRCAPRSRTRLRCNACFGSPMAPVEEVVHRKSRMRRAKTLAKQPRRQEGIDQGPRST